MSRFTLHLLLLALAIAWIGGLWFVPWTAKGPKLDGSPGDLDLHRAVVERVHAGERYYDVLGEELKRRGYPTASAFNWRLPPPLIGFARLPDPSAARWGLALLAVAMIVWAARILLREFDRTGAVLGSLALACAALPAFLDVCYYSHLLWSTVLIGLSLCAHADGRTFWAILFGVAAAFCREMAIGYCLAAGLLVLHERRYRAALGWAAGIAIFLVYLGMHVAEVHARTEIGPLRTLDTQTWWHLNGVGFLAACTKQSGPLLMLPDVVAYVYLSVALFGFTGAWKTRSWMRIAAGTTIGYLFTFLFIGKHVHAYWGTLFSVPLAFGLAGLPESLTRLKNSLQSPRPPDRYD